MFLQNKLSLKFCGCQPNHDGVCDLTPYECDTVSTCATESSVLLVVKRLYLGSGNRNHDFRFDMADVHSTGGTGMPSYAADLVHKRCRNTQSVTHFCSMQALTQPVHITQEAQHFCRYTAKKLRRQTLGLFDPCIMSSRKRLFFCHNTEEKYSLTLEHSSPVPQNVTT